MGGLLSDASLDFWAGCTGDASVMARELLARRSRDPLCGAAEARHAACIDPIRTDLPRACASLREAVELLRNTTPALEALHAYLESDDLNGHGQAHCEQLQETLAAFLARWPEQETPK